MLNETTSVLHTQSKRIDEVALTKITITVAHRFSTIQNVGVTFAFANGRITEKGLVPSCRGSREVMRGVRCSVVGVVT